MEAPDAGGGARTLRLTERPGHPFDFLLSPWPFKPDALTVEGEARPLPAGGRLTNEAAMSEWLKSPERVMFRARLIQAESPQG